MLQMSTLSFTELSRISYCDFLFKSSIYFKPLSIIDNYFKNGNDVWLMCTLSSTSPQYFSTNQPPKGLTIAQLGVPSLPIAGTLVSRQKF
jgi:hypothetical protein